MTKLMLLVEYYEREKYDLSHYSADYMLTKPKGGYEAQYREHKEKLALLEEMIGDYEGGEKDGGLDF